MEAIQKPVAIVSVVTTIDNGSEQTVFERVDLNVEEMGLEIANSNSQNVSAFKVQVKFHESGSYVTIASAAIDYTNPAYGGLITGASGSLVTLVKNTSGWLHLRGLGLVYAVKFVATSAGASSVLTISGRMR